MFKLIKPQVFLAILALAGTALYSLHIGHIEVATGATAGVVALGMKLLETEQ